MKLWVLFLPAIVAVLGQLLFFTVRTEFPTLAPADAVVLITGTSSGLGREYVKSAVASGYNVIATVRKEKDAASLREEFKGKRVKVILLDITSEDQRVEAVESVRKIAQEWKAQPYALINNAASGGMGPFEGMSADDLTWSYDVLIHGPVRLAQLFRPLLSQHKAGRILFIGSTGDRMGMGLIGVYTGLKAGLHSMVLSMRNEWAFQGIAVSHVWQGPASTKYFDNVFKKDDDVCRKGVEDKKHAEIYCKHWREQLDPDSFMPKPDSLVYPLFDAERQSQVVIDSLSSSYPTPEVHVSILGQLMVLMHALPEWLRELAMRVRA